MANDLSPEENRIIKESTSQPSALEVEELAAPEGFRERISKAIGVLRGQYSVQPRFREAVQGMNLWWSFVTSYAKLGRQGPQWGSAGRDRWLRNWIYRTNAEPILTGAIYSIISKLVSLGWTLTGPERLVENYIPVLEGAEDGEGWSFFLSRFYLDYLICDMGGITELGKDPPSWGPVRGIYNLDATKCEFTGEVDKPLRYLGTDGSYYGLRSEDFFRMASMPSPADDQNALGMSAVSRSLRAAMVLDALYNYEEERLLNLPPEGIATITGMTMGEVQKAFALYKASRESKQQLTFPGILWLVAQKLPLGGQVHEIKVHLEPFSQLPPYFNKIETVEVFVKTLAVCFGVDVGEFWQTSQPAQKLKGEATIQAQKAKGKGLGEMIAKFERMMNTRVLPRGVVFAFDLQDVEDQLIQSEIQRAQISNVRDLYFAKALGEGAAEPLITREESRWLLVKYGVLPPQFVRGWEETADIVTYHRKGFYLPKQPNPVVSGDGFLIEELDNLIDQVEKSIQTSVDYARS